MVSSVSRLFSIHRFSVHFPVLSIRSHHFLSPRIPSPPQTQKLLDKAKSLKFVIDMELVPTDFFPAQKSKAVNGQILPS
jgi:hypothetical protein